MDEATRKIEKRNRPPVSCEPCRTRKMKCNRALPCDTCTKRNKVESCQYAPNAARRSNGLSAKGKARDLKDRLESLETLLSSVMSQDSANAPGIFKGGSSSPPPPGTKLPPETPHLQEWDGGQVNYIDSSHWQSILEDIREVKEHLSPSSTNLSDSRAMTPYSLPGADAGLLFGSANGLSIDEVLAMLPEKPICDMLLSWYFNTRFMVLGIVHPAKFQEEYISFRESPSEASPLWIGLLFSILSVTTALRQMASPPASVAASFPSPKELQQATAQCLILGKYATANAYAIETFMLHMQSCFFISGRLTPDLWFLMGAIIRLAIRMGYHRDPDVLAGISVFEGEMRRRLWLNIVQIDALMSFQAGFPSMIPSDFCDTRDPRNLDHSDLHTSMQVLPPSRPLSEQTPVLYTIVKSGVMSVFRKIVHHTQLPIAAPYEKTVLLEQEIRRAYSNVPEMHQRRDVDQCFADPVGLILERYTIELLYLKGIVILLRRFVSYDPKDDTYTASRRACVEAALEMLHRQADISNACEVGGRLYEDRWMFASLAVHDFLLAAMVISLDLSVQLKSAESSSQNTPVKSEVWNREYTSLQTSSQILKSHSPPSRETSMAAQAIDLMLRKVTEKQQEPVMLDEMSFPYVDTMSQMIEGTELIDWSLLDQYFQDIDGSNAESMPGY